jgi:hypothetical protein
MTNTVVPGLIRHVPVVMCPGCNVSMALKDLQPLLFSSDLYTAVYRCEQCGTETKREFKRDE